MITRTGWSYEDVDELSMCRTVEFLDYEGRSHRTRSGVNKEASVATDRPLEKPQSDEELMKQFMSLQTMIPGGSNIPEHLREKIRWAEAMKNKHGLI